MSRSGTQRDAVPWTAQELSILHRLRRQGLKFVQIAAHLPGRTMQQCEWRYNYSINAATQNEKRRLARAKLNAKIGRPSGAIAHSIHPRIDKSTREQQLRRLEAYDARDISASIFGDPPRGFSALDLRERANT